MAPAAERVEWAEDSVRKVYPLIQATIYSRLGVQIGEEVLGNAIVAIMYGIDGVRGTTWEQFRRWCYRIAFNKINDALRSKYADRITPMEPEELAQFAVDELTEDPARMDRLADLNHLLGVLAESRFPCNRILVDRFILGLDPEEIAMAYNVSKDAARMKVLRCLEAARKIAKKLKLR